MKTVYISLISLLLLQSCLPAAFTAATVTTVTASKDQTIGESVDDFAVWAAIEKEFVRQGFKDLFVKINVKVSQGRVLLTGEVNIEAEMLKAVEISWDNEAVKEVINELKINSHAHKFKADKYALDTWITSNIKGKILLEKSIKYINYTVVTYDQVVYLFGIARSEEELKRIAYIASEIRGVEKVISHVKVKQAAVNKI